MFLVVTHLIGASQSTAVCNLSDSFAEINIQCLFELQYYDYENETGGYAAVS